MSVRTFQLVRDEDVSGVSGTGVVAEGALFTSGKCVIEWLTEWNSMAIYRSMEALHAIHGHGGRTRVVWTDDSAPSQRRRVLTVLGGDMGVSP